MRYKAGDVVKIDKTRFVIERVTKKGYILFPHIGFFVKDCRINKKIKVKKSYELGDKFKDFCGEKRQTLYLYTEIFRWHIYAYKNKK